MICGETCLQSSQHCIPATAVVAFFFCLAFFGIFPKGHILCGNVPAHSSLFKLLLVTLLLYPPPPPLFPCVWDYDVNENHIVTYSYRGRRLNFLKLWLTTLRNATRHFKDLMRPQLNLRLILCKLLKPWDDCCLKSHWNWIFLDDPCPKLELSRWEMSAPIEMGSCSLFIDFCSTRKVWCSLFFFKNKNWCCSPIVNDVLGFVFLFDGSAQPTWDVLLLITKKYGFRHSKMLKWHFYSLTTGMHLHNTIKF